MKEALSLRKQNKQAAALPRQGKGQGSLPRAHLPSEREAAPNPRFKRTPRPYSMLAFIATSILERQTASFWKVKKTLSNAE